ncbi:MAG TPA: methyltransferase domain-containing protein [Candidatus Binataceae bacterium]|jgi:2-polyprenyl-3-methyl-5-hydroxy-6-metoxy-1,4-benzoquinol methylase|nr:methyltransferase domain-containing protein [Candidatus Binataceae bacterium]
MAGSGAQLDREKARRIAQEVVADAGGAMHAALCYIGDRLGIFKAMMDSGAMTADQLAARTGLKTRYLREWLGAMAAAHYVDYDRDAQTFILGPEYAAALADEDSPFFVASYFQMAQAAMTVAPKVAEAFAKGGGVTQAEYPPSLFEAFERNSGTRYKHKLLHKWLPSMPQVVDALEAGGTMVDIGCGGGRAAIMIAQAFTRARVVGLDLHRESIERARRRAAKAGLSDRVVFEVGEGSELAPENFDFISTFDVIHDAADPAALMRSMRRALKSSGTCLVQEINVSHELSENLSPLGKMAYSISTLYCLTTSLANHGAGMGIAMGEPKARELAAGAGFSRFQRLPIKDDVVALFELRP